MHETVHTERMATARTRRFWSWRWLAVALLTTSIAIVASTAATSPRPSRALPERLTDAEFWSLISEISEPGGYFRLSDNFTSNEMEIGQIFGMLHDTKVAGGAYVGVGPEQNYTYIAAIHPDVAFVIDIRRQAVVQHLLFKAIFELSRDRADFIALLFSKARPAGLDSTTTIQAMWDAYAKVATDSAQAARNYQRLSDHLLRTHHFTLTDEEVGMLKWVWEAFTTFGPGITTNVNQGGRGGGRGNFALLTSASSDASGQPQSFLSSESNYRFVKSLQERNMLIPVSGDFAGPKALRAIGAWLAKQGTTVSAYYLSNVEQYLFMDVKQDAFYANVATLPLTASSVFIRPYSLRGYGRGFGGGGFGGGGGGGGSGTPLNPLCPMRSFLAAVDNHHVTSYNEALACVQ